MESAEWTGRVIIRVVEFVQSNLDVLLRHLLPVVFFAFLVEAAGLPFPSRILLLVAATLVDEPRQLVGLVAVSTTGALIGDHVPYLAGALTGPRILAFYCRMTLGSAACVEKTIGYFRRFGAAAILLARFSTSVRLFASALSGCGHITYGKFLAFDVAGTLLYTTLCVTLGYLVGEQVAEILGRHGAARLLLLIGPLALAGLIAYRLWRRSRYGRATADVLVAESSCVEGPRVTL
jgi:membrane protein DedA with SNARE-associated domain